MFDSSLPKYVEQSLYYKISFIHLWFRQRNFTSEVSQSNIGKTHTNHVSNQNYLRTLFPLFVSWYIPFRQITRLSLLSKKNPIWCLIGSSEQLVSNESLYSVRCDLWFLGVSVSWTLVQWPQLFIFLLI